MTALHAAMRTLRWRELAVQAGPCPFCGHSLFLRLQREETAVRCLRCRASAVHLSLGWALRAAAVDLAACDAYELSARGPLVRWLRSRARSLVVSEFFDDVAPGGYHQGVRCEDVQALTLPDACMDLVTHTEVFEHVPDDSRGWRELWRVLRPGGLMVFTVPLGSAATTVERARPSARGIEHLLPPTYHGDQLRGPGQVLVYRDYGADITTRLLAAGFVDAVRLPPDARVPWGFARPVLLARKAAL